MKLYNTLSRKIEDFKPQTADRSTLYTCGPTVYDYPHIGNWFTYIREDILVRTLKASGLHPYWVMNITDVGHLTSDADEGEDKLEKGARRENKTAWQVAEYYTDYFQNGMKRLGMLQPDKLVKATDHISEQIKLISTLEEKGYTYTISDGVYFDTSKFKSYADFARLDLKAQQQGARVEINHEKRNGTDFALWKFSPEDHKRDMEWPSPFKGPGGAGTGFPGWHIECSAMAMEYLGETLDIHAGGIDHIPVHHTNEIAQSEAATGKQFSRFWYHANHIMIDGGKISKSSGNGITLEDIEKAGFSLDALRLLVLESHYRTQSHFSWDTLQAAQNRLQDLQAWADMMHQPQTATMPESIEQIIRSAKTDILKALQDDLNTPVALSALSRLVNHMSAIPVAVVDGIYAGGMLEFVHETLGLNLCGRPDITPEQKSLIQDRQKARENKNWAESDKFRESLAEQGIGVRDTPSGPIWRRL